MESTGNDMARVFAVSEDSVDIYDDLDLNNFSTSEKSSPNPSQLKESMDLYEEIVTEEQQGRESSYTELKSRFQAAQHQIKELHRRLQQMEIQNTGLNTENNHLKKNISALLRTARQEVMRKDAVIQRLNQSSGKGHCQHSRVNNLHDQNFSSQALTISMSRTPTSKTPSPSRHSSPPRAASSSSSRDSSLPKVHLRPPKRENNSPNNKASASCIATRVSSYSHSKGSSSGHCLVPDKRNELSISNSVISSTTRHRGSDKHKTENREEQCQKLDTQDRKHRTSSAHRNSYTIEKDRSHKLDKDSRRRHASRTTCKSRDSKNVDGYCRSERSKSPPINNLHSQGSSDACRGRTRERRHEIPRLDSQHSTRHCYTKDYSRRCGKIKMTDEHSSSQMENSDSKERKRSSTNQQVESYGDFSKEKQWDRLSKKYQWKGDRQHKEMTSRRRRNSTSERRRLDEKQPSEESHNAKCNAINRERQGKMVKTAVKEPVEENSQNRKLCFMETLNLTLSPIKKPVPNNTSQDGLTDLNRIFEGGPDDSLQAHVHVIDQIDGNELHANLEELPTDSVAPSEKLRVKDVLEKDTSHGEARLAGQQAEGTSAQTISSSQSSDSAVNCMAADDNTSLTEKDGNDEAKTKLSPDSQLDSYEQTDVTGYGSSIFGNVKGKQTSSLLPKGDCGSNTSQCNAASKRQIPGTISLDKVMEYAGTPRDPVLPEDRIETNPGSHQTYPVTLPRDSQPGVNHPSFSSPTNGKDACCAHDDFKDADAVSSTICLELVPQQGLSLPETMDVLVNKDNDGSSNSAADPSSSAGCIAVSKVSSTTEEIALQKSDCEVSATPKKNPCENSHAKSVEPSSSVLLLHDEDSMMRTLCHLERIPDAISPLRSPIHQMKTSHLVVHGKPGHVKSLQKEFSNTADEANSKKLDLNKENKYPACPLKYGKLSELPSNRSDTELEQGKILSGGEESHSPPNATKRVKVAEKRRNKEKLLERKSEAMCFASKEMTTTGSASTQSPGSKSRFKTVCPTSAKAPFSTIEEVMEMFTSVRLEIRKKYMKLHKAFPKKSFFGVMENFRESFVECVDGAHFGHICCQATELKSKLKVIIGSVFNKVADNGIVKRIFDQQAVDLKQKLWVFVDKQVDFLLKDIDMTLKSLCRPPTTDEKMSSENGKTQSQQKDSKGTPSTQKQIQSFASPRETGLGSRGKDIRITHAEKENNCAHTQNYGDTYPGVDCLSPKKPLVSGKLKMASLVAPQSTSVLDKSDFELLTEQQTTSLTFNLVRDSQMGEIFKCLLQGSDLLETSGITGESTSWTLGTPKKNGERLISITTPNKFDSQSTFFSPTKFASPSKLIATWSSISPWETSPRPKDQVRPNPALLDESCLLEVPSENQATPQSGFLSQRDYSILAEDLAVSLTIPSPLKSDSHLSFLQPSGIHTVSTPDSVISAHISEDALLDGEDATEQDIHLTLDTDNSSLESSNSVASQAAVNTFVLKPELPMQALVMEKSNDHFIVKIRQGTIQTDRPLTTNESLGQTLTEKDHNAEDAEAQESQAKYLFDKMNKSTRPCNVMPAKYLSDLSEDPVRCQDETNAVGSTEDHLRLKEEPSHSDRRSTHSKACVTEDLDNVADSPKAIFKMTPSKGTFLKDCNLSFGQNIKASPLCVTLPNDENPSRTFHVEKHSPNPLCPSETIPSDSQSSTVRGNSESSKTNHISHVASDLSDLQSEMETSRSDKMPEDTSRETEQDKKDYEKSKKRKTHHEQSKAKRSRKDDEKHMEHTPFSFKKDVDSKSFSSSPNSLSAMNVVKKKGALVIAWTRDEDRAILVDLKTKGASRKTFAALSDKLKKPSEQVAQRFYHLMKLFKKQGTLNT
ncbi:CASP8-associated protein 2 isoform X1 [Phyllopteryx taeniolatus]|uniref:CASP8-associated protein 2 isoform X1 n=1 Tax=Phyllopteryx taeniolatus TaxID=161469 RepID=UPI002AD3927D|nr:CASP8-associated protein 2 isoform X1 [Phyllopteryx taeniolatus]